MIVYPPKDRKGEKLAEHIGELHASVMNRRIQALDCSAEEKRSLLDNMIRWAGKKGPEQGL